ncbi:MAG: aminotransferase class III-fold pyridoxal phosphate-dependent enzyme [Acetobacteraceae bacterium]
MRILAYRLRNSATPNSRTITFFTESHKPGGFARGFTCAGHPVATAVALEMLRIYERTNLLGHVRRVGPYPQERLGELASHPLVGDVRGVGMLAGVELVVDKERHRLLEPGRKVGALVQRYAREAGLIVRAIDDRIALSPPLIIGENEVDEIVSRLGQALARAWREIGTDSGSPRKVPTGAG